MTFQYMETVCCYCGDELFYSRSTNGWFMIGKFPFCGPCNYGIGDLGTLLLKAVAGVKT